jgi:multiple sugar transport system permease protein
MKRLSPSFRILRHVVLMVVALVFLMPFIWMVLT